MHLRLPSLVGAVLFFAISYCNALEGEFASAAKEIQLRMAAKETDPKRKEMIMQTAEHMDQRIVITGDDLVFKDRFTSQTFKITIEGKLLVGTHAWPDGSTGYLGGWIKDNDNIYLGSIHLVRVKK